MTRSLCALLLCLPLAACASQPRADETVTLRFWGMGREGEVVAELMDGFHRENPGIRVQVQQIPWTAAHEKLLTAFVGGAMPDVAQLGNTWVSEFAAIRALVPLDSLVQASASLARDDFFPGIWDTNVVSDTAWGVPWYVDTRLIFYRSDILRAAGYETIPDTWAGWLEAMRAVKQLDPARWAIFLPTNEWAQPALLGMQNGATLLGADGTRGAFTDPAFREAFDFYLAMYRSGLAPPMGHHDVTNPYQEMARGTFAMWITGPWNMGEFRRRLPEDLQDDWATAPMPGPTGAASGLSLAGGSSLVMFRGAQHRDAAWKLIEFLSRPEQQQRFYELTGSLPAHRGAWEMAQLATGEHSRAFWEQLQRVRPLPPVPEIESIMARLIEHSESAIRGGVAADAALRALDRDTDRILEKRAWLLARGSTP